LLIVTDQFGGLLEKNFQGTPAAEHFSAVAIFCSRMTFFLPAESIAQYYFDCLTLENMYF